MAVILPNVPSVVRFAVSGTNQGQPFVNVFHANYTGAGLDGNGVLAAAQALLAAYHSSFGAIQTSLTVTTQCAAQDLTSRTSPIGIASPGAAGGDSTGSLVTTQVALCVSWVINDRYRGGHPRNYIPGLIAQDISNGRLLTTTGHTKWNNATAGFLTDVNAMTAGGVTWRLCCVRYFSQHQLLPNPLIRLISSSAVHQRIDTQRRRLGKEVA